MNFYPPNTNPGDIVEEFQSGRGPHLFCSLCRRRAVLIGIFEPGELFARRVGHPEGKTSLLFYSLCAKCNDLEDHMIRVEKWLLSGWQVQ